MKVMSQACGDKVQESLVYGYKGDAKIENLAQFLRNTKFNTLFIRTTYVMGGWHDNEFDANAAGFHISRTTFSEFEKAHEFSTVYQLIRK